MTKHFQREIISLKKSILSVGTRVEESLRRSIKAFSDRDEKLAQRVAEDDKLIDEMEVEVEEECLKILALYQPVAIDLRYIVSVLKINNDLERIGDLAANVAERVVFLATKPPVEAPDAIPRMAKVVQVMLKDSLDALVQMDTALAKKVLVADNEVDSLHRGMYRTVEAGIRSNPEDVEVWLHLTAISRYLERAADHTTNIAEDVIYMVEGEISRHQFSFE